MNSHTVDQLDKETAPARLWGMATRLALFTIAYNLIEGLVSIWFGAKDEALTLFGFGIDSFIEVLSGVGILIMILRIRHNPDASRTRFEEALGNFEGTLITIVRDRYFIAGYARAIWQVDDGEIHVQWAVEA